MLPIDVAEVAFARPEHHRHHVHRTSSTRPAARIWLPTSPGYFRSRTGLPRAAIPSQGGAPWHLGASHALRRGALAGSMPPIRCFSTCTGTGIAKLGPARGVACRELEAEPSGAIQPEQVDHLRQG